VKRLTYTVRDRRAGYEQTLNILSAVKEMDPTRKTKSAILLGFGETTDEVIETMRDLRAHDVDLLSIGKMGFTYIASGPLVRSSYKAYEAAMLFNI
jgi:lipoic acid synthetase